MKNLFILIAVLFLGSMQQAQASVLTVSNDGSGGSQYSTLLSAYNAAANGDTLMLEGTNVAYSIYTGTYPANNWNKSLTVIGIGFNPQKDMPRRSIITHNAYYGDAFYFGASASGTRFYGIEFSANVLMNASINNMLFEDCKFNTNFSFGGNNCSGFAFVNCIFDHNNDINIQYASASNAVTNVTIMNCVFDGYISGNSNNLSSMSIDHCLFLINGPNSSFNGLYNALIKNSVFMNTTPAAYNSNWLNNMSVSATQFANQYGSTGSGNILGTNPNMVNYTLGNYYATSQDYHLQSGSPAIGLATDGTDIGIHGGYSKFSERGEVLITPIIRSININQTNASPGGTINVNIHASKPNDQ